MSEGQIGVQNPEDDSCEVLSSPRSSPVRYSDESFATYTGENKKSRQSYSQSFESYQSFDEPETGSEISAIKSELEFMSPQNFKADKKEEFSCCEDSEGIPAREKLIEKFLEVLNCNRFVSTPCHQKGKHTVSRREAVQTLQLESEPAQTYCSIKIDQIQRQRQQKQPKPEKYGRQQLNKPMGRKTTCQENYVVPQHLINQVRLKYITEAVKQVVETNMHQPTRCADCFKKISELAEHNFLRIKKIQLEEASMQEKIEEHIYTKDALTLIGEIHNSLPKYSDAASLVWRRLFAKLSPR
ncbi:uncharacterized protein C8orf48 homolog [Rhinoraja longicauda]